MKTSAIFALTLSLSVLAGCAGVPQILHTYPGEPKDVSQIAVVRSRANEFAGSRYSVMFVSFSKLAPGQKLAFERVGSGFRGYPTELRMLPGRYLVLIRCETVDKDALPSFSFEGEAGATYEVVCEPVADQPNTVKATVNKVANGSASK